MSYDRPHRPIEAQCLQVGDQIPSYDGYVHEVKRLAFDDERQIVYAEFWKGPHHTYETEFEYESPVMVIV